MAARRTSGRDFGTGAKHCMGARHLLCSSHSVELEIRLHHPPGFLSPDYGVSDCGGVALAEDGLNLDSESDRPDLRRVAVQSEVTKAERRDLSEGAVGGHSTAYVSLGASHSSAGDILTTGWGKTASVVLLRE